jgi:hypothetical protein
MPIYIPFRDPDIRFKSGLTVSLYRNIPDDSEMIKMNPVTLLDTGYDKTFKANIEYLDYVFGNSVPFLSGVSRGYKRRPYHLFDDHLDYSLYIPFLLILHRYNVKLVYLEQWSDHLKPLYPLAEHFIKKRERKKSSTTNTSMVDPLWSIYKSVFIDRQLKDTNPIHRTYSAKTLRWHDWMAPEREIFKVLKQYRDTEHLRSVCIKILPKIIDGKIYFTDPFGMAYNKGLDMLAHIQTQKPLLIEFEHMLETHNKMKYSMIELSLREYVPVNTPPMVSLQNPRRK